MNHADHVNLLRRGISGSTWADLGSGGGAFTLALADLLGPGGTIYSVDADASALREQKQAMQARFPAVNVIYQAADFTHPLDLPLLDGVVMANSLHFVAPHHKEAVLQLVKGYLRPGGRLILVEYNVDHGNFWVPHPLAYDTWAKVARHIGFAHVERLAVVSSRFLKEIYSALSY